MVMIGGPHIGHVAFDRRGRGEAFQPGGLHVTESLLAQALGDAFDHMVVALLGRDQALGHGRPPNLAGCGIPYWAFKPSGTPFHIPSSNQRGMVTSLSQNMRAGRLTEP